MSNPGDIASETVFQRNQENLRRDRILRRFDIFNVGKAATHQISLNRVEFRAVARHILNHTHPGREQELAITALEEAKYWTNQSIAKDGVPQ